MNDPNIEKTPLYFRLGFFWPDAAHSRIYDGHVIGVETPCWLLFLLASIPTAFLWYRDRRPPKGHCQTCGYDLTGNVTGICPECGTTA
jgi:hypothetical protein